MMNETELVKFVFSSDLSTTLYVDGKITFCLIIAIILLIILKLKFFKKLNSFEIDEAEIGIGDQKIKLKPNEIDLQVAYKIWVELSTRKIGLPIDFEHDVITEIYDSWYSFFAITRDLIKDIPATKFKRKETEAIIRMSIAVLNAGIRPHLTIWQAKFRRWYKSQINQENMSAKSPQEIQKCYPLYRELSDDLREVNQHFINYRQHMYKLISQSN